MTNSEITKEIKEIEDKKFDLRMKDSWNGSDYELMDRLNTRLSELKKIKNN